jgi:hypothetical protein
MNTLDPRQIDNYQDRMGRAVAARLSDGADSLPNDISERLKAARMQALAKRKVVKVQTAAAVQANGGAATLMMGDDDGGNSLWNRLGSLVPLLVLIIGLLAIAVMQEQQHAKEVADVDVELLADELPPSAYTDPGFVHFLNAKRRD